MDAACDDSAQRRLQRDTTTFATLVGGAGGAVLGAASVVDVGGAAAAAAGAAAAAAVSGAFTTTRTTAAARQAPHTQIAPIVHTAKRARARSNPQEPNIRFADATVSSSLSFRPSETKSTCTAGTSIRRQPCRINTKKQPHQWINSRIQEEQIERSTKNRNRDVPPQVRAAVLLWCRKRAPERSCCQHVFQIESAGGKGMACHRAAHRSLAPSQPCGEQRRTNDLPW
jgi:hypothetical protein